MAMELKKIFTLIGISVLIGLVLAIVFGFAVYIIRLLWRGLEGYNYSLTSILGEQMYALILIMPILAGIVAAICYYRFSGGAHLLTGAFSGLIAGVVLGALMGILAFFMTLLAIGKLYVIPVGVLFQPDSPLIICVSAAISSICSAGYLYTLKSRENNGINDVQGNKETRMVLAVVILFIVAIVLLPQAIAYIGISAGLIEESHSWYFVNATAMRQGNQSIVVMNAGGQDEYLLDEQTPFIITINGKAATNADTIEASGLEVSISPSDGLGGMEGDSVTYSGPSLATGENTTRLVVLGVFKDGREQALILEDI